VTAADVEPWVTRQALRGPAWFAVTLPTLPVLLLWLVTPSMLNGFATLPGVLRSVGLLTGLCAFTSFAITLVMGARLRWVERLFRSLDRMYRFHRRLGLAVGGLLAAHIVLLVGSTLAVPHVGLVELLTEPGVAVGVAGATGFAAVVAVSVLGRLPHETFQRVHRLIGLAFVLAALHVLLVPGVRSTGAALDTYLAGTGAVGVAAWLYRSLLGSRVVRRHPYRVAEVTPVRPGVHELVLTPVEDPLHFEPGQLVFIAIDDEAVTDEAHPFSITSGPGETSLRLVIKAVGDFTTDLAGVSPGSWVRVEGPYGGFWHRGRDLQRQVWIAGGIGVTPFLAMARALDLSDRTIDFHYGVPTRDDAVFFDELGELAEANAGLRLHVRPTDEQGYLDAAAIRATAPDLAQRHVFLCGPPQMLDNLLPQLRAAGVPADHLHFEDFRLRGR
jgi:predicted ferric reductase